VKTCPGITSSISTLPLDAVAWREEAVYVERKRRIERGGERRHKVCRWPRFDSLCRVTVASRAPAQAARREAATSVEPTTWLSVVSKGSTGSTCEIRRGRLVRS
jgi:hypothetical protein